MLINSLGALAVGILMLLGCKGPQGPAGSDAVLTDTLPPWIEWLTPSSGDTVDTLLSLSVRAGDDQAVARLTFSIAGFDFTPDSSVADRYFLTWFPARYPEGPYPLVARVWDATRNTAITPMLLIYVRHNP
ncbi:MAG: hypothetical protein FJY65_07650 [Calditrichaeota bacterium]|nr:hypothetical protein [Calditrichota bacterium]